VTGMDSDEIISYEFGIDPDLDYMLLSCDVDNFIEYWYCPEVYNED